MTYTTEQLSDKEKIREAAMRYSYGVDRLSLIHISEPTRH